MHRTQDTYSLSHFRQHTREHLERLEEGRVETITQNGEAAMIVMSPQTYDMIRDESERGHLWDRAIQRYNAGHEGIDGEEAIEQVAAELKLKL